MSVLMKKIVWKFYELGIDFMVLIVICVVILILICFFLNYSEFLFFIFGFDGDVFFILNSWLMWEIFNEILDYFW